MFTKGQKVTLTATDNHTHFPIGGIFTYIGLHPEHKSYASIVTDNGVQRYVETRYMVLAVTMKDVDSLVDTIDKAIKKAKNL